MSRPRPKLPAASLKSTSLCDRCAALCCRYIALPIDNPTDARDYDNIRWYLLHENIVVFIEEGQWYIGILTRCKQLRPDNRCGIYETRPRICRSYTTDNCDYHGGDYNYDVLFTSAEQVREFAEKELGRPLVVRPKRRSTASADRVRDRGGGRRRVRLSVI
jgi:Fe-S-cluster containining protein